MPLIKDLRQNLRLLKEHAVIIISVIVVLLITVVMPIASIGYLLYAIVHLEHLIDPPPTVQPPDPPVKPPTTTD